MTTWIKHKELFTDYQPIYKNLLFDNERLPILKMPQLGISEKIGLYNSFFFEVINVLAYAKIFLTCNYK